jgi:L-lysine 2,3-aminomutase
LHTRLLARLPGYLVPRLVREAPGAASKLPAGLAGHPADRC